VARNFIIYYLMSEIKKEETDGICNMCVVDEN
jgi:hypothetical protein